ncbi:MAG: DUF2752 domain-containing protein [Deltaproteobacteria bacterium]|nr:DUF2752 domain-containing protein [Deltaproteobacteria bacterium]
MIDTLANKVNEGLEQATRYMEKVASQRTNRVVGAVLAVPSWTVLGLARWLDPNPQGYGTHLQLGMSECTMMHFTGYPCPMCGMTTTFALYADLRVVDALLNQPFGLVLFGITVAMAVIGALDVATGRGYWKPALAWVDRRETKAAAVLLLGMLGGWIYKVLKVHPELLG